MKAISWIIFINLIRYGLLLQVEGVGHYKPSGEIKSCCDSQHIPSSVGQKRPRESRRLPVIAVVRHLFSVSGSESIKINTVAAG